MTKPKDAERVRASVVRIRRTNSYGSRATIARHLQHLSDMCLSPKSLFLSYVDLNKSQEKGACRNPPCDVAIDRTALRIRTTAVRSLANSCRRADGNKA